MKKIKISLCLVTEKSIKRKQVENIIKNRKIRLTSREDDSEKIWWIELPNIQNKSVLDQIKDLVLNISTANLVAIEKQLQKIYFDIVVLYDTYTCSIELPCECIKIVAEFYSKADVIVSCYPCSEDLESTVERKSKSPDLQENMNKNL